MTRLILTRGGLQLAAVLIGTAIPGSTMLALADDPPRKVEVTASDVAATNEELRHAYGALVDMWTENFEQLGAKFSAPHIARYRSPIQTACGIMRPSNAVYCPGDNTIYYDEIFVAGQAKAAALELGTDGDMTAVGVIAHEMGHAVAIQRRHEAWTTYQSEATADCLAGAFAEQSKRDGTLEEGDIEEAMFGMSTAGDVTPDSTTTGNRRADIVKRMRASRSSHGTREQRTENFRSGLEGGAGACLPEFR